MSAVLIYLLNVTKKIKNRHVTIPGKYTEELRDQARQVLLPITENQFAQAWRLYGTFNTYTTRRDMDGIGGCTQLSMRDLYDAAKEINAETV